MKNILILLVILLLTSLSFGHRMLLMIEDNEDGTIYVEAGLSTGNVPASAKVIVKEKSTGRPLWQGKVPSSGKLTIKQPTVPYTVTLDAGAGHGITKEGPLPKVDEQKQEAPTPVQDSGSVEKETEQTEE